jgi:hypothetical protein
VNRSVRVIAAALRLYEDAAGRGQLLWLLYFAAVSAALMRSVGGGLGGCDRFSDGQEAGDEADVGDHAEDSWIFSRDQAG